MWKWRHGGKTQEKGDALGRDRVARGDGLLQRSWNGGAGVHRSCAVSAWSGLATAAHCPRSAHTAPLTASAQQPPEKQASFLSWKHVGPEDTQAVS